MRPKTVFQVDEHTDMWPYLGRTVRAYSSRLDDHAGGVVSLSTDLGCVEVAKGFVMYGGDNPADDAPFLRGDIVTVLE